LTKTSTEQRATSAHRGEVYSARTNRMPKPLVRLVLYTQQPSDISPHRALYNATSVDAGLYSFLACRHLKPGSTTPSPSVILISRTLVAKYRCFVAGLLWKLQAQQGMRESVPAALSFARQPCNTPPELARLEEGLSVERVRKRIVRR